MAQETLNAMLQLYLTLSRNERRWLLDQMKEYVEQDSSRITDEQKARLRKSYEQGQSGQVFTHSQAQQIMTTFVQNHSTSIAI